MTSLAPPPFPAPIVPSARKITGHILTEMPRDDESPPTLERQTSVAGDILLLEDKDAVSTKHEIKAYSLQRKIKDSMHGSVLVGFELKLLPDVGPAMYELVPNVQDDNGNEQSYRMVSIKICPLQDDDDHDFSGATTTNEAAALQWIAAKKSSHLLGPVVIGQDATHIYMVSPYYHKEESSLFDYCGRVGRLSESEGRSLFRQILQVSIRSCCHTDDCFYVCFCIGVSWSSLTRYIYYFQGLGRLERIGNLSSGS